MIYEQIEEPEKEDLEPDSKSKKKQKKKPSLESTWTGGIFEATWRYGKPLGNGKFMDSVTGKIYKEIQI